MQLPASKEPPPSAQLMIARDGVERLCKVVWFEKDGGNIVADDNGRQFLAHRILGAWSEVPLVTAAARLNRAYLPK